MTSNVGASSITENKTIGFVNKDDKTRDYEKNKEAVLSELKKTFRPEFLNRLDEIIVFRKLDEESVKEISRIMLEESSKKLKSKEIDIEIAESLVEYIAKVGFDATYGARPLKRAVQSKVEDYIAEKILDGEIKEGDKIKLSVSDNKLSIEKK